MNRRAFLKGLLGTAAAAALPVPAPEVYPLPLFGTSRTVMASKYQGEWNAQTRALLDSFREVTETVARRGVEILNERWEKPGDNPLGFLTCPDGGRASGEAT